jgi:beta-glucosidase
VLVPPETGTYRLGLAGNSGALSLDGKPLVEIKIKGFSTSPLAELQTVHLEKGHPYSIRIDLPFPRQ